MEHWNLQGHRVDYEDATHSYFVDGIPTKSFTQILHWKFPAKYENVDIQVLERAAKLGTAMHQAIQDYEEIGVENDSVPELYHYKFLKEKYGFEFVCAEIPVLYIYKNHYFVGRLDEIITYQGKTEVNDFKRTATLDKEYLGYQLNLYRLAYQQTYGVVIEGLHGTHLRCTEKTTIRKFIEFPINEEITFELLDQYLEALENECSK